MEEREGASERRMASFWEEVGGSVGSSLSESSEDEEEDVKMSGFRASFNRLAERLVDNLIGHTQSQQFTRGLRVACQLLQ